MICSLQSAIDAINAMVPSSASERDLLVAAKCRGLMAGYHDRWNGAPFQVEGVEKFVTADLINPATNTRSRTFRIAGKLDITAWYEGERVIVDHKTTSEDITDPGSPYWRQLAIDTQATHYMLLELMHARKAAYALWDVLRKPSIAPKTLTKADGKAVLSSGKYFGRKIGLISDERETLEMYESRLAYDCTNERPNWYFGRRMIPRLDSELAEYASDLWADGQEIIAARANNRHSRNPGACLMYGRPCNFLGICSGHDSPDSDRWKRKSWMHKELPADATDGRDVLTNSRLKSFRTCHRKHFYEYEMGIERVDEEEAEALLFGNVMHAAQEAWWLSSTNPKEKANECYSDAVIGIAPASTSETASAI